MLSCLYVALHHRLSLSQKIEVIHAKFAIDMVYMIIVW